MEAKDHYIGLPSGVILCIDQGYDDAGEFSARMYSRFHSAPVRICCFENLIREMIQLFDDIRFPLATLKVRDFRGEAQTERREEKEKEKYMSDQELLAKHGDISTFIIRVQQRQNGTMQGRITWVDENKTMRFRSALEMIKLIESGIIAENPEMEKALSPTWDDSERGE